MIDEQVNVEELSERRGLRDAAENATDDGMPVAPEHKTRGVEAMGKVREKMAGFRSQIYAILNVVD
jgi:hypothetical protein